jgi:biotin operon repressor
VSPKATRVLAHLRKWGPSTQSQIALWLDMPEPSVRRVIQELRGEGHNITFITGRNACYTLVTQEETYAESES